jgi:hypothetical protein
MRRAFTLGVVAMSMACAAEETEPPLPPPPSGPCAAGELELSSGCVPAGVDACADGFESDGRAGCRPILPAEPCPAGQVAELGETACRPVADCGQDKWGNIPVDGITEYVDASYAGGDSDGSAAKPWTTIQAGVSAAQPNAIVAIAEGSYTEDVDTAGHAVKIWGRCPDLVEVVGQSQAGAINLEGGAANSEVRGLAVRGPQSAIVVSGALNARIEEVWVHHAFKAGIVSISVFGESSTTVAHSLIEQVVDYGIFVIGTPATVEGVVVRDVFPLADGTRGHGIGMDLDEEPGTRAAVTIRRSLVERAAGWGILTARSDSTLTGVLVRDPTPDPASELGGICLVSYPVNTPGQRATTVVSGSVLERCRMSSMIISGSDLEMDTTVVRDTAPQASTSLYGMGMFIQRDLDTMEPSTAVIRRSLVERSLGTGIYLRDSEATLEGVLARETTGQLSGNMIGDGFIIDASTGPASAVVHGSRFEANTRAGLAWVGAHLDLSSSRFECNAFHLDGEPTVTGTPYSFQNLGGNACGCAGADADCKVLSAGLDPPDVPIVE